jgi:hypothetical protein
MRRIREAGVITARSEVDDVQECPPPMNSTPTAARPTYRARLLRLASTPAVIVATPHASHTICHKTLSMAASFWALVHFDHTGAFQTGQRRTSRIRSPLTPFNSRKEALCVSLRVVSLVTGLAR